MAGAFFNNMNIIRQIESELGVVLDTMYTKKDKKIIAARLYIECPDGMQNIDFDINSIAVKKWLANAQDMIDKM